MFLLLCRVLCKHGAKNKISVFQARQTASFICIKYAKHTMLTWRGSNILPKLIVAVFLSNTLYLYLVYLPRKSSPGNHGHQRVRASAQIAKRPRRINAAVTDYDVRINQTLQRVIQQKLKPNHPEVLSLIRELLDPPSEHILKCVRPVLMTPQASAVKEALNQKVIHV